MEEFSSYELCQQEMAADKSLRILVDTTHISIE